MPRDASQLYHELVEHGRALTVEEMAFLLTHPGLGPPETCVVAGYWARQALEGAGHGSLLGGFVYVAVQVRGGSGLPINLACWERGGKAHVVGWVKKGWPSTAMA